MSINLNPSPRTTTADLVYYGAPLTSERPYDIRYETSGITTNVIPDHHLGLIHDLRNGGETQTSIDVTGFEILEKGIAKTGMEEKDFESDELIRTKYYEETIQLLKKVTGATKVIIFDHTLRRTILNKEEGFIETAENRQPVAKVHCDQTPASGLKRVYRHAGDEAEKLLKTHCKLINLWRPLHTVHDRPLAFIDYRTINPSTDLIPSRLLFSPPIPEGETYQIQFNPAHKWYYLSEMEKDEAILLQCWTNEASGGVITPHTGILDNSWDGEGRVRESIEVRALCFLENREI